MKKVKVLGSAAFALLLVCCALCVFIGCPADDSSGPEPAKMVFADSEKEFTINENLGFNVSFKAGYTFEIPGIISMDLSGKKVWGTINSGNAWDAPVVEGEVGTLNSNDSNIRLGLAGAAGMPITLTYTESGGQIIKVEINFPMGELEGLAALAGHLMEYDISDAESFQSADPQVQQKIVMDLIAAGYLEQSSAGDQAAIGAAFTEAAGDIAANYNTIQFFGMCNLIIGGTLNRVTE